MFETRGLRIFFLTRHVSLAEAFRMITRDRVLDYIRRCTAALRQRAWCGRSSRWPG